MPVMLTVSQLNAYVKSLIDADFNLNSVYICGEISNFTNHYRTGHLYFSLKDENAAVKAVMFRTAAQRLRFEPQNGMRVIVRGSIGVFERDGVYQLYADDMQPDGAGALNLAFEQLKKRLDELGIFDPSHKKELPKYPEKIAVVTSPTGAAVQDIISVLARRFPYAEVLLAPVQVQGDSAPEQITDAIDMINVQKCADLIIVGRGGGSMEDLWSFNNEGVAMAIYNSDIPVISAVGHETDYTIADFVADFRAPTPSAAAEVAVPDMRNTLSYIDSLMQGATDDVQALTEFYSLRLSTDVSKLELHSPQNTVKELDAAVKGLGSRLGAAGERLIYDRESSLSSLCAKLEALNPLKVLTRGYALAEDESGRPIKSAAGAAVGQKITVRLSDGRLGCTVNERY